MAYEFTDNFEGTTTFKMGLCSYQTSGEAHRRIALWDGNRATVTIHMDLKEALRMAKTILDLVDQSKGENRAPF